MCVCVCSCECVHVFSVCVCVLVRAGEGADTGGEGRNNRYLFSNMTLLGPRSGEAEVHSLTQPAPHSAHEKVLKRRGGDRGERG